MAEVVSMPPMEESAEDREAKELLAQWGNDDSAASDDASVDEPTGDYDDDLEKFRRDVYPKDNELDHIVLATSDLELAMDNFEKLTG